MNPNQSLLRRGLSLMALSATWAVACTATDPGEKDQTSTGSGSTTESTTSSSDTGIDPTTGAELTGGIDVTMQPPTANCGDGVLDEEEACDDGTPGGDDGCGANCLFVEPGFICAEPGEPCNPYSKCGDGVAVFPEQCDGGPKGVVGCSADCKLETGYKCEGSPSTCTPTVCGDGVIEGTETCEDEDGNTVPFDGCDANCNSEPDCSSASGMGCTSSCGDGLIIGDEECDDGNGSSGDGCSADCKVEEGYTCSVPELDSTLPLNLPIVFRDFSTSHPDFQDPDPLGTADADRLCNGYSPGIAAANLSAEGKPVYASSPTGSCVESADSFTQWYTDSDVSDTIVGTIDLFPNGKGGYVNRFGADGEQYITALPTENERQGGATLAACEAKCEEWAINGNEMFTGEGQLRCQDSYCQDETQAVNQAKNTGLVQAQNNLTQAEAGGDADAIAAAEDALAAAEQALEDAETDLTDCQTECQDAIDDRVAICAPQCIPCSNGTGYCVGGELLELDGNPLFFPIDEGTETRSPASERSAARIPAQVYQGLGWPWEDPSCTDGGQLCTESLHNFAFTSEISYWFEYNEDTVADLTFLGDDDVWVAINRHVVLDIGGIHVPLGGQLSLAAGGAVSTRVWQPEDPGDDAPVAIMPVEKTMTAADLGLVPGNVYEIKVFHAERKPEGSSFQLTLAGFNAPRSTCVATCGDGIIAGGEQCDDGAENNTGGHNRCAADCTLGAFCGDGVVQSDAGEECDDNDPVTGVDCSNCRLFVLR